MVRGLQNGEPDAATELFETFQKDIYYFILKTVDNDHHLAEDLTQDTFIKILEKIGELKEPAAFVTWSKEIAYHKCTDYFKKRKEILLDENEDGFSEMDRVTGDEETFDPELIQDNKELKQALLAMINDLPAEQRSALLLRYFNEIPVKEIAQIQGVTEGTVKSRLNYGRKALKLAIENYEKKNDIKLHCTGVIPLLLWLFREYCIENGLSLTAKAASTAFVIAEESAAAAAVVSSGVASASTAATATSTATATTAAKTAAGFGIKTAGKALATKVVASVAAASLAIGGVTVGVTSLLKPDPATCAHEWQTDRVEYMDGRVISLDESCTICGLQEHQGPCEHQWVEADPWTNFDTIEIRKYCEFCGAEAEPEFIENPCSHETAYCYDDVRPDVVYCVRRCPLCNAFEGISSRENTCTHDWVYKNLPEYNSEFMLCTSCGAQIDYYEFIHEHDWYQYSTYEAGVLQFSYKACETCTAAYEELYDIGHGWVRERGGWTCSIEAKYPSDNHDCDHDWIYHEIHEHGTSIFHERTCSDCGVNELLYDASVGCEHEWHTVDHYKDDLLIATAKECANCLAFEELFNYCRDEGHLWEEHSRYDGDLLICTQRRCTICSELEVLYDYCSDEGHLWEEYPVYEGDVLVYTEKRCRFCEASDYIEP